MKNIRPENKNMEEFLKQHGIDCKAKFLWSGSCSHSWMLYNANQRWTIDLANKLTSLGFKNLDNQPLGIYDGNGGVFSACVKGHNELVKDVTPPSSAAAYNFKPGGGNNVI